ncbi:hypothetical protein [Chitinophaga rhizophila]|uniref:Uncharacterized protein n=1 Tax=Chitinophaga rhizophila TaxID=2866212 RepID=A0ABS7GLX5_9BACT|nr:hypothetical protein [Chitinophaga rhizophila]MBW8687737.1 hypothetical protein [Chitinophaga rhizophila]
MKFLKRYINRVHILQLLLALLVAIPASAAGEATASGNEEVIHEGVIALNRLIRQNDYNDRHNRSARNKYVIVLDGNGKFIEQRNINDDLPLLSDEEVTEVNDELVKVNDSNKFGVYEIVFNNWYINLTREIPENADLSYLTNYQPWTNDNIRTKIISEMKALNLEIFKNAAFKSYQKRVGIVCGRVIVMLGGQKYNVSVTMDARGDETWTAGELRAMNERIDPYLPSMANVKKYLIAYPQALKNAWLNKDVLTPHPELPYHYKPGEGSFLNDLAKRSIDQQGSPEGDPAATSESLVYDYAGVLSKAELQQLINSFLEVQNGGYTARVFIANYKTPREKLEKINAIMSNPAPKDILLYLYLDADKTVHADLKLGKDIPNPEHVNMFMRAAASVLEKLGLAPTNFTLAGFFDGLSHLISKAEIPERFYNPASVNEKGVKDYNPVLYYVYLAAGSSYILKAEFLAQLALGTDIKMDGFDLTQIEFAFMCGAYNGLVEMIASLPKLAGWMVRMVTNENGVRDDFSKTISSFVDKCDLNTNSLTYTIVMPQLGAMKLGSCLAPMIAKAIKKTFSGGNACTYAASGGKIVFNILILVAPLAGVAEVAKIADIISWIDPIALLLRGTAFMAKVVYVSGRALYSWGKYYLSLTIRDGRIFLETLGGNLEKVFWGDWPQLALVMDGVPVNVRVPPSVDLSGEWRAIRYMTDSEGSKIITQDAARLIEIAKKEGEPILGIVEDTEGAGKAVAELTTVAQQFKARLLKRMEGLEGRFELIHTDEELMRMIQKGKELKFSDELIEDFIYISCRKDKARSAEEMLQQMEHHIKIKQRGYPERFTSVEELEAFGKDMYDGLKGIGLDDAEVIIQGSALRTQAAQDVDIAVIISEGKFNDILIKRFSGKAKNKISGEGLQLEGKSTDELMQIARDIDANRGNYNNTAWSFKRAMLDRKFGTYTNDEILIGGKDLYHKMKAAYPDLNIENISFQVKGGSVDLLPNMSLPRPK